MDLLTSAGRNRRQDTVRLNVEAMLLDRVAKPVVLRPFTIYRAPANIRDSADNKKHYEPSLVSIGPYHNGRPQLRAMEDRKRLYLQRFLDDSPPGALQEHIDSLRAMEPRVRACYFESPDEMGSDEFVEMLLLDGCFILQFFIQWYCGQSDPIFGVAWNLPLLHTDLLLLENQIPYFVLSSMYATYYRDTERPATARPKESLMRIIAGYFGDKESKAANGAGVSHQQVQEDKIDHLLHLYHCHFIAPPPQQQHDTSTMIQGLPKTVRCAKELSLHGVTFQAREKASSILDVAFRPEDGTLEIPCVSIEESTCSRYMNLVAFEQCRVDDQRKYFTSYVMLMDYLINTADDVLILDRAGVMENKLSNDEEVARFFNQLRGCSYIDYDTHYLAPLYVQVSAFCGRSWPRYKAILRRDYLSNPWAKVGFFFASLFAVFTIFSTIVSILQTFFHLLK